MKESDLELIREREGLVTRIASERNEIIKTGSSMRPMVKWIGKAKGAVQFLGMHPQYVIVPAALIALSRRRRLFTLAVSGVGLWRMMRKVARY